MAPTTIKATLGPLVDGIACSRCKEGIQQSVKSLVAAWVGIKVRFQTLQSSRVPDNHSNRPRFEISHALRHQFIPFICSDYTSLLKSPPLDPSVREHYRRFSQRYQTLHSYLYTYHRTFRNRYTHSSFCTLILSNSKSDVNT